MSNELALPGPVIEPSDVERAAVALMAQIGTDGVEARAKKLKEASTLAFDKPEPIEVPAFVARKIDAETTDLEAQIDALQKRSPA